MKPKIKCAWCGLTFVATAEDRPQPHSNGGGTCVGGAQQRKTHEALISFNAKHTQK